MPGSEQLEAAVQRAVNEAVDAQLADLRQGIVDRVLQQVRAQDAGAQGSALPDVAAAIAALQTAHTQADVLSALLSGAAKFAGRVALFVIRAGAAIGYQARGFDEQVLRALHLSVDSGMIAKVINERSISSSPARDFDPGFVAAMNIAPEMDCVALPLLVKDKVAALLYADAGRDPVAPANVSALELLVGSAALWLEVLTVRKHAAASPQIPERSAAEPMIGPTEKVVESVSTLTGTPAPVTPSAAAAPVEIPTAPEPAAPAASVEAQTPQDQEIHRKAQRFAKLLVDEIKLYNPAKVAEGRQHKDLYDRLKEDIEKSRATYDRRYGQTAASSADYFNREVIRILANNDNSLLGSNFPG
jgi:hypothetical protein